MSKSLYSLKIIFPVEPYESGFERGSRKCEIVKTQKKTFDSMRQYFYGNSGKELLYT